METIKKKPQSNRFDNYKGGSNSASGREEHESEIASAAITFARLLTDEMVKRTGETDLEKIKDLHMGNAAIVRGMYGMNKLPYPDNHLDVDYVSTKYGDSAAISEETTSQLPFTLPGM